MSTSIASVRDTGRIVDKVDIIMSAYSSLRISGLTVQPTPNDLELALMRLEDMAAEWESRNIIVGYNFEENPDPNTDSTINAAYKNAFARNLAICLIPDFNKQVPPILFQQASASLSSLSGRVALERLQEVDYPRRMPLGSGNTLRYNRWASFYRSGSTFANVNNSVQMFIGDINDYTEHFDSYLNDDDNEIISSFDIQVDSGLKLVSSSNTDTDVIYRIEAENSNTAETAYGSQVTIIVTTSTGRVDTKRIFFSLIPRGA